MVGRWSVLLALLGLVLVDGFFNLKNPTHLQLRRHSFISKCTPSDTGNACHDSAYLLFQLGSHLNKVKADKRAFIFLQAQDLIDGNITIEDFRNSNLQLHFPSPEKYGEFLKDLARIYKLYRH
jgi:hypothetical protein